MLNTGMLEKRLAMFGYQVKESDSPSMAFCVEKVANKIKNEINCENIPDRLLHIAVDMAAGEFLLSKKTFEPGSLSGIDLDMAVKEIKEGDTTVVFGTGEGNLVPEQRLDIFINYLLDCGKTEFSSFRRLKW